MNNELKLHFSKVHIIIKKELINYLNTPLGYIFSSLFILLLNFLFFFGLGQNSFWDMKSASLEQFFLWIPILFILFIPAVTMGLWSEEKKSGTLEILLTLPFMDWEVVLGKFLSAWLFITIVLSLTTLTPITVIILGNPDIGLILSGYLGAILLGGAYIVIGLIVSSLSPDQVSSYVLTLIITLIFFLMGYQPILKFLNPDIGGFISYLSLSRHFDSFRFGLWDIRDFYYFLSFYGCSLVLNVYILRGRR